MERDGISYNGQCKHGVPIGKVCLHCDAVNADVFDSAADRANTHQLAQERRQPADIASDIREAVSHLNVLMQMAREQNVHVYISAEGIWQGDRNNGKVEIPASPTLTVHRIKQQLEF